MILIGTMPIKTADQYYMPAQIPYYHKGPTQKEIAQQLGISRTTLWRHMRKQETKKSDGKINDPRP
jgi:DNA-binding transcriptional regulator LsrR (DeoR family)